MASSAIFVFMQIFGGAGLLSLLYLLLFDPSVEYEAPELPFVLILMMAFVIILVVNGGLLLILIFHNPNYKWDRYTKVVIRVAKVLDSRKLNIKNR